MINTLKIALAVVVLVAVAALLCVTAYQAYGSLLYAVPIAIGELIAAGSAYRVISDLLEKRFETGL